MLVRALLRHLRKKAIQKVTDSDPHLPRADRSVAQKSPGSYQLVCAVIDDPNSKPLAEPKTCRGRFSRPMGSGLDFVSRARPATRRDQRKAHICDIAPSDLPHGTSGMPLISTSAACGRNQS